MSKPKRETDVYRKPLYVRVLALLIAGLMVLLLLLAFFVR